MYVCKWISFDILNFYNFCCNLPHATCHMTLALSTYHMQLATCNLPHVTCHMLLATCNLPHVTCHMQLATCNLLHATCHMTLATCDIKTCGLPRIVCFFLQYCGVPTAFLNTKVLPTLNVKRQPCYPIVSEMAIES